MDEGVARGGFDVERIGYRFEIEWGEVQRIELCLNCQLGDVHGVK